MRVSVIIPLYNQGQYVHEAIDSVRAQTYKDREIIVVNDASTDDSLKVLERYTSDEIKIIDREKNGGLSAARNSGIAAATGELILPLDADDYIDPTYLAKTVALMQPGVGIVSSYLHIFPDAVMYARHHGDEMSGQPGSGYPIFAPTKKQILTGNCLCVCSLIRKEALIEAGGYDETMLQGAEDWALWASIVCLDKWKVDVVPEHIFHYRVHPNSFSRSAKMAPFHVNQAMIRERHGWPNV